MRCGSRLWERLDPKQRRGRGERLEVATGEGEDLAVLSREPPPDRGCLGPVPALAEDRPCGRLVR